MASITLFEFSPQGDIQIGPSGAGEEGLLSISTSEDAEMDAEDEQDESGGGLAKVIVPLVALIAIADEEAELGEESGGRLDQFKTTTE